MDQPTDSESWRAWLHQQVDRAVDTGNFNGRLRAGIKEIEPVNGARQYRQTGSMSLLVTWNEPRAGQDSPSEAQAPHQLA